MNQNTLNIIAIAIGLGMMLFGLYKIIKYTNNLRANSNNSKPKSKVKNLNELKDLKEK